MENSSFFRAVEELKVQLSKAIQEKEELKASVDELNTKLQAELSTKEYFERALMEAKNTLASNKEELANLEEENKQLERNLLEAQEQLEKAKEKSDALDKEHKELQEIGQTLKRKEEFQNDLYDTVRKIQENLTELERQGQEKKIEFMTLKEKMKDEMLQKDSELDELNKTLQKLEVNIQLICTGYQLNTIKDQWTTVASIAAFGLQKAHHYTAFSLMFSITTGSNTSFWLKSRLHQMDRNSHHMSKTLHKE
ncbi:uncharacterized protein PF3D7_1120000-like isoform X1 [Acropora muricata]|uniref:uncharacterized protein PF3D7_1120000-like isoform X1 n=2 Tax=Acropora muricata TaxID=159855 RepID=UPI0034E421E6